MSELSHYIKLRSGECCNVKTYECDKYLDCEICLEDKIKKHDSELLDKVSERIKGTCDMQDLYLPIHFIEIIEDMKAELEKGGAK